MEHSISNPDTGNLRCPNCGADLRFDMHAPQGYKYVCQQCHTHWRYDIDFEKETMTFTPMVE